ncbi:MAG: tetratricopeptide repeat protein [Alphaproteobacteria bacterium]
MTARVVTPLHQAALHEQAGRSASAEKAYKKALQADPNNRDGYRLMSGFYARRGKLDQAEAVLRRGIARTGNDAGLRVDLGTLYQQTGRPDDAAETYRAVLAEHPDHAAALTNLAGLSFLTGAYEDGLAAAEEACRVAPDHPAPHSNRGNLLAALGRFDAADDAFARALALDPDHADARANHANHLKNSGRIEAAHDAYRDGVQRFRHDPRFAFGLALTSLGTGDLATGWACYEAGFATGDRVPDRRRAANDWFGGDLAGKTLLIWPEQGLGDELLFASCLPDLRRALPDTRIILECDSRLLSIYQQSFPFLTVVQEDGTNVREVDAQAPIGRLPGLFRQQIANFGSPEAYLLPDKGKSDAMAAHLADLPAGRKIGISWRSGLVTQNREHGLTDLDDWAELLSAPGIVPVNLQYGDVDAELEDFQSRHGITIHRVPDLDLRDDLDGVFGLIANLDCVVNVGTSIMGMAGALGAHQHVLLREQEWITLGTDGLPWFANATVHQRKVSDNWEKALESVRSSLV